MQQSLDLLDAQETLNQTFRSHQEQIDVVRRREEVRRREAEGQLLQLQTINQQQVSALREQLAATAPGQAADPGELDDLRKQFEATRHEAAEMMAALENSWDTNQALVDSLAEAQALASSFVAERDSARHALEQSQMRLTELANEQHERITAQREKTSVRRRPDLDRFLDKLFSRCDLDEESIEELFKFGRTDKVVHELMRIDATDPQLDRRLKMVQGYPGWRELSKINTGGSANGPMGRIYFRPHAGGVETVVHLKKDNDEQKRFMARRLSGGSS
ncbi:hypothetical protein [Nocardioides pacificus]